MDISTFKKKQKKLSLWICITYMVLTLPSKFGLHHITAIQFMASLPFLFIITLNSIIRHEYCNKRIDYLLVSRSYSLETWSQSHRWIRQLRQCLDDLKNIINKCDKHPRNSAQGGWQLGYTIGNQEAWLPSQNPWPQTNHMVQRGHHPSGWRQSCMYAGTSECSSGKETENKWGINDKMGFLNVTHVAHKWSEPVFLSISISCHICWLYPNPRGMRRGNMFSRWCWTAEVRGMHKMHSKCLDLFKEQQARSASDIVSVTWGTGSSDEHNRWDGLQRQQQKGDPERSDHKHGWTHLPPRCMYSLGFLIAQAEAWATAEKKNRAHFQMIVPQWSRGRTCLREIFQAHLMLRK